MMPKLDGISVLKELKGDTSLRYIPVILVTAKADTRDIVRGLEAGGDDYLTKPFEQAALLARVRSLLRIKELHDTAQLKAAQLQRQTEQLSSWNRSLEERSQRLAAKEIAPNVRRMGFMFHPQIASHYRAYMRELGTAAASLAAEFSPMPVRDGAEIEAAVTALAQEPGGGLIVATDPFINTQRRLIVAMVERHRLPAIYGFRRFVREVGALISYGPDSVDNVRRSASYVDRILKGEKPADLPVQNPTKYELGINLKTAKALGITVPPSLLARADEVIE